MQMKELRASVEDVSQRNMRYNLIKGSRSKATMAAQQSSVTSAALFGIDEARHAAKQDKSKVDLVQLINEKENDLRVIAVWGTTADLGQTSIMRAVYENPDIKSKFSCRAWVKLMHPFHPKDFIQSLVEQFRMGIGAKALLGTEKTAQELAETFDDYVSRRRYLIVINDLYTIEVWDRVKSCFPNNSMGSRIIVATTAIEVASLCAGHGSIVSELKQLSDDKNIYAFHEKVSQDGTYLNKARSSSSRAGTSADNNSVVPIGEILEDHSKGAEGKYAVKKTFTRIGTMVTAFEESHLVGREKEKNEIIKLISNQATQQCQVISVWGMGGLGKTTLVKDIFQNQVLNGTFDKRACITIMRPFILIELVRSLVMQLNRESSKKKVVKDILDIPKDTSLARSLEELMQGLVKHLKGKGCLIVIDDVSSTVEWDMIIPIFVEVEHRSRIIVTTREENIAKHCSKKQENVYRLKDLEYQDARDLFTKKVFKETIDLDMQYPELVEQAELILRKCGRPPLAIVTIGGFLSNQPKKHFEWKKLNEHISAELEMNPELGTIRSVLMRSYDGLPYHLKSCFLYMPIFPEDRRVRRARLARRWSAEGYSREVRGRSAEDVADSYFMDLISRSMILPSQGSMHSTKGIDSCQVHDLMREIGISKSIEENLVFTLEEGCNSNNQVTIRHLAINGNWKGDQSELESIVDMSRVRSITIFGECNSFFISDKMSLLRVLDLEDATGLHDHHLKHIGKLVHLRYLSLRGCDRIFHLPDSLGNLRELLTLDVRGTNVIKLPNSIINLQKLNNLCAGMKSVDEDISHTYADNKNMWCMAMICISPFFAITACLLWCAPADESGWNGHDIGTLIFGYLLPKCVMRLDMHGVLVPRGVRKLKALRILGVVNIARWGKDVLNDIKGLTQLRKLGVTGINVENGHGLCSAVVGLSHLESLSIRSEGEPGLSGCLDGKFSFPENLQSLKLCGNLVKLPEWIQGLKNLVKLKLKLRSSMISEHDAAIKVLGSLPNLASLHLLEKSFEGEEVHLNFCLETFQSLVVLQLELGDMLKSVKFERGGATPKLELLKLYLRLFDSSSLLGLPSLSGLKEVVLIRGHPSVLQYVTGELALHPNRPVVKRD